MALSTRYMVSMKNVPSIFQKIVDGTAPPKFTLQHLKDIGFPSSGDRGVIPLLKDLGFLNEDGTPTSRYHAYRNPSQSKRIMAEALREAYGDLFTINARPSDKDRVAIQGKFRSALNATDRVAEQLTITFFTLLKLADLDTETSTPVAQVEEAIARPPFSLDEDGSPARRFELSYTIQIHLPASTDVEVYNAIFKSLREHVLA